MAQLAGYVSEHSAYHHGEASLMSTIVGLAQNFCGSNNINLLVPSGQFGTRLLGESRCPLPLPSNSACAPASLVPASGGATPASVVIYLYR